MMTQREYALWRIGRAERRPFLVAAALWCVGGVPLLASAEGGAKSDPWAMLQFFVALGGILIGLGASLQQLVQLHRALSTERAAREALEAEVVRTYARVDVVSVQHAAILKEMQAIRGTVDGLVTRLESFFPTLNAWTTRIEDEIHECSTQIAVLQAEAKLKR